jgi:hypothetical protein
MLVWLYVHISSLSLAPTTRGVIKGIITDACIFAISVFVANTSRRAIRWANQVWTYSRYSWTFNAQAILGINNLAVARTRKNFIFVTYINALLFFITCPSETNWLPFIR